MTIMGTPRLSAAALALAMCVGACKSDSDDAGEGTGSESETGTDTGTGGGDGGTDTGEDGGSGSGTGGTSTGGTEGTETGTGGTGATDTGTGGTDTGTGGTETGTGGTDTGTGGTDTGTGGTGTTSGGVGDANCGVLMDCIGQCQDQPCVDACLAEASPQAQGEANDLMECVVANNCQNDMQCVLDNCSTEYEECFTGDLACDEVATCLEDCGGDEQCQAWCYYEGTAEAQDALNALNECIVANNCQDFVCIETNCGEELDACFG